MKHHKYTFFIFLLYAFFSCKKSNKFIKKEVFIYDSISALDTVVYKKQPASRKVKIQKDTTVFQKDSIVKQEAKKETSFIARNLLGNRLSMSMPNNFTIMDKALVKLKYPRLGNNAIVYSNRESTVSIAVGLTKHQATDESLFKIKDALDIQYNKTKVKLVSNTIKNIKGKDFILIEFISTAIDGDIYNLMAITILDNHLLMSTFNCTGSLRNEWESKGKSMVNSIKFL